MIKTDAADVAYFDGPFFFGLDELHLIGMGLCQKFLLLLTGKFNGVKVVVGDLSQSKPWWNTFKSDLHESRKLINKTDFDGSFRYPWSKFTTRAVDWITLVCYVVPTLVVPSIAEENTVTAVMALVRFVQMTQQRKLTERHLDQMDRDLQCWNTFLDHQQTAQKITYNFTTPNHHLLRHITQCIRKLGPMSSYSCRSMERSIGGMKQLIRANKDSGINAMNIMVDLAALTYIDINTAYETDLDMEDDMLDVDDELNSNDDVYADDNMHADDIQADDEFYADDELYDDDNLYGDDEMEIDCDDCDDDDTDGSVDARLGKSRVKQSLHNPTNWPEVLRSINASLHSLDFDDTFYHSSTAYRHEQKLTQKMYIFTVPDNR